MADKTTDKKVWLVTGASRGMGVDIAQAALAAGHAVVATGRDPERVRAALGVHDDLLAVALNVTDPASAQSAVAAQLAGQEEPPLRWVAGPDAVAGVEQKAKDLLAQVDARREPSTSLAHDETNA
jgi:NAD(P)-dependent dehydrogenase (short-subunit alcohol dehydrogenase family)